MDDCVGCNDAVWAWISLDDLEFYGSHSSAYDEIVVFMNRTVCLEEVRLQIDFEQVTADKTIKNIDVNNF